MVGRCAGVGLGLDRLFSVLDFAGGDSAARKLLTFLGLDSCLLSASCVDDLDRANADGSFLLSAPDLVELAFGTEVDRPFPFLVFSMSSSFRLLLGI